MGFQFIYHNIEIKCMLPSKFKYGIFFPVFVAVFLFVLLFLVIFLFTGEGNDPLIALITIPVCILFLVWIILGELRTKAIKVTISYDRIEVRRYLGYGNPVEYWFSEIEEFTTVLLPSEYRDHESLNLIKGERKIIKLSEFYHENYFELKENISVKCKELKSEKYNLLREIKEILE